MNEKTRKITYGAMTAAIFGVMLLINRQSGGMFQELFLFILPIPMVAYSVKYGLKTSLPVFVVTILISFVCGTFSALFYAVCESFIGMVYGSCLHDKKDPGKTMVLLMFLSCIVNIISGIVLASLFGFDLDRDIEEVRNLMLSSFDQAMQMQGATEQSQMVMEQIKAVMTTEYVFRIYVVTQIFTGVLQGFVIYELSLIILRRLRFPVQKPRPVYEFFPPKWTGYLALVGFVLFNVSVSKPFSNAMVQNLAQSFGMLSYFILVAFGYIGTMQFLKYSVKMPKAAAIILPILAVFAFPVILVFIGFSYLSLSLHDRINEQIPGYQSAPPKITGA